MTTLISRKNWEIFKIEKNRENVADAHLLVVDSFNFAEKLSKVEKWSFVSSVCEKGRNVRLSHQKEFEFSRHKSRSVDVHRFQNKTSFSRKKFRFLIIRPDMGKYTATVSSIYISKLTKAGTYQK